MEPHVELPESRVVDFSETLVTDLELELEMLEAN